jgi:hypothetical protein
LDPNPNTEKHYGSEFENFLFSETLTQKPAEKLASIGCLVRAVGTLVHQRRRAMRQSVVAA